MGGDDAHRGPPTCGGYCNAQRAATSGMVLYDLPQVGLRGVCAIRHDKTLQSLASTSSQSTKLVRTMEAYKAISSKRFK
jgi:hypothetical protein